jgi:predicted DNA-binding transcriptional regulator AlpA
VRARDEIRLPSEVADRIRVTVSTLETWRSEGRGPAWFRIGKKNVGYLDSAVESWIAEQVRLSQEKQASEHRQPRLSR